MFSLSALVAKPSVPYNLYPVCEYMTSLIVVWYSEFLKFSMASLAGHSEYIRQKRLTFRSFHRATRYHTHMRSAHTYHERCGLLHRSGEVTKIAPKQRKIAKKCEFWSGISKF